MDITDLPAHALSGAIHTRQVSCREVMQATLAILGCLIGLIAAWSLHDLTTAISAALLGLVVPFTLIVIFPTNKQLLAPSLDAASASAGALLAR